MYGALLYTSMVRLTPEEPDSSRPYKQRLSSFLLTTRASFGHQTGLATISTLEPDWTHVSSPLRLVTRGTYSRERKPSSNIDS